MREIYHGSPVIVQKPELSAGKEYNDYGQGFYCTENIELAMEWSVLEGHNGYCNCYEIDDGDLRILDLGDEQFGILHWLTVLVENRRFRLSTPLMRTGVRWLEDNYHLDTSEYDVIIGYRADDSYFSFARAFLNNSISLSMLERAMHLGKLGEQYVLKSERAFDELRFSGAESADTRIWYPRRKKRDEQARQNYMHILEKPQIKGIYIRDLIEEATNYESI